MSTNETDELLLVAVAVADGEPVDWESRTTTDPAERGILEGLRVIEAVSRANRRALDAARSGSAPQAGAADAGRLAGAAPTGAPGLSRWGSLEILEKIGEGGFGDVYRAHDPSLGIDVALKLLKPESLGDSRREKRFLEEARRLARVRHPNVVVVHGADRHQDRIGLWTDLVRGQTLEELLEERGEFGVREAAVVGIDLCHALAAVHSAGLVHRDVKTANVMREQGGRILLMDFGAVGEGSPEGATPEDSGILGTPLTMAPEQLQSGRLTPATDIYGLGVLLYRLLTRRLPIEATSFEELMGKHALGEHVPLRDRRPELPPGFVQVIERCLDPDPDRRYATAGMLERALAAGAGVSAAAANGAPGRAFWRSRANVVVAAALLIVASLFTARVLVGPTPDGHQEPPGSTAESENPGADTPAPRSALTAAATLYRSVNGLEEPVLAGAEIATGTLLSLRFESAESTFVYILDEDEAGRAFVLFPIPGLEPENPLPPGETHRLPGRREGRPLNWEVTSAGGKETIVVIASRHRLEELERDLSSLPRPRPGGPVGYPELSSGAAHALRGIGGLSAPPAGAGAGRISEALGRLSDATRPQRDMWVWQTLLSNPERP